MHRAVYLVAPQEVAKASASIIGRFSQRAKFPSSISAESVGVYEEIYRLEKHSFAIRQNWSHCVKGPREKSRRHPSGTTRHKISPEPLITRVAR
jgi:hypothetical protein